MFSAFGFVLVGQKSNNKNNPIIQRQLQSFRVGWLVHWGLMALSAQIGYIVPLISTLQLKKVKLMRKLTILRVGNT